MFNREKQKLAELQAKLADQQKTIMSQQTKIKELNQQLAQWQQTDLQVTADKKLFPRLMHHIIGYFNDGGHYQSDSILLGYSQFQCLFTLSVGFLAKQPDFKSKITKAYQLEPCYRNRYGAINKQVRRNYCMFAGNYIIPTTDSILGEPADAQLAEFASLNSFLERVYYSYIYQNHDGLNTSINNLTICRTMNDKLHGLGYDDFKKPLPIEALTELVDTLDTQSTYHPQAKASQSSFSEALDASLQQTSKDSKANHSVTTDAHDLGR